MGGCWTLAIAAALPGGARLRTDLRPDRPTAPERPKAQRGKLCGDAGTMTLSIGDSGCAGGLMRSMTNPYFDEGSSKDPGFAKKYISYFKYGDASRKKHGPFEAMDSNPFVSRSSTLRGERRPAAASSWCASSASRAGASAGRHQVSNLHLPGREGRRDAGGGRRAPQHHLGSDLIVMPRSATSPSCSRRRKSSLRSSKEGDCGVEDWRFSTTQASRASSNFLLCLSSLTPSRRHTEFVALPPPPPPRVLPHHPRRRRTIKFGSGSAYPAPRSGCVAAPPPPHAAAAAAAGVA